MIKLTDPDLKEIQDAKVAVCSTCGSFVTYLEENYCNDEDLLELIKSEGYKTFQNQHMTVFVCKECANELNEDSCL